MVISQLKNSPLGNFVLATILVMLLLATLKINFLLFHTLSELFAVIVAFIMFVVASQTYRFTRNHFLVFLGICYLWIGSMDLLHTLVFKGINIFPDLSANISIQFWIATRFMEAITLLLAPVFLLRQFNKTLVQGICISYCVVITLLIVNDLFPVSYVEQSGLTMFKVASEYTIIGILLLAVVHLWHHRKHIEQNVLMLAMSAIIMTMLAEVSFTLYLAIDSLAMVMGHIFKFISFWLIFTAIIKTTLTDPYSLMSRTTTTYDAISTPIVVVDTQGIVHQANRAVFNKSFYSENDVFFQHCHNLFHDKTIQPKDCVVCQHINSGTALNSYDIELPEERIHYEITLNPIQLGDEFNGMVHSAREITDRVRVQRKLQESELQFRQLAENIHAMFWMLDPETDKLLYVSPAYEKIWGRSRQQLLNNHYAILDTIHPDDRENMHQKLEMLHHEGMDEQYRIFRPDRSLRWIHDRAFPLKDRSGYVYRVIGIAEDITHLIEADDARRASEAKSEFLSRMSHELRTPMNAILGFAQLLKMQSTAFNTEQKQNVDEIIAAGKHLLELINEVLDMARIESGKVALSLTAVDAQELLNDCITLITPLSQEKNIHIQQHHAQNSIIVNADPMRLKQAILNLLSNAVKYNRKNGSINLYLGRLNGDHTMQLDISDTGIGISREDMPRLFQPFERLPGHQHVEGTGIGLALSRHLVELMGGDISVKSQPGQGSTFTLTLPLYP